MSLELLPLSFGTAMEAIELVRARLLRATAALNAIQANYAVAGGNAVAVWVARVDRTAIPFTQDVDILVRRSEFDQIRAALESAGFVYRHLRGIDVFLDGPNGRPRNGIHLIYANEQVRPGEPAPNPDPSDSERADEDFRILSLDALVQIKLTALREKDVDHLQLMLELGLIDRTWLDRVLPSLRDRLLQIIDPSELG